MKSTKKTRVPGLFQAQVLIYLALIIILGGMGFALFYNLNDTSAVIMENGRISINFNNALLNLKSSFGYTGFIHNFKNYVLRGNPKYLDSIKTYYDKITDSIKQLKESIIITDKDLEYLITIQETADSYMAAAMKIKPMVERNETIESIDGEVKINDGPAGEALASLDIRYKEIVTEGSKEVREKLSNALFLFLGIIVVSVVLFILLIIYIFRRLINQVKAIGKVSKDMSEGDLSKEITIIPKDAIGDMAENFNAAIASLKKIISGVVSTANEGKNLNTTLSEGIKQINISSGEMSKNLDRVHEKIKEENDQISEASSALEEISANTSSLSAQIGLQADSVNSTSAAVEEITASIQSVSKAADSKKTAIDGLIKLTNEGSEKIESANTIVQESVKNMGAMQEMLEVINKITSQTNLLSMNAAIEAAHAGDAGKGFAVVAEEIRKLAESTAENANEVSDSLNSLISKINQTAEVTTESGNSFREIEKEVRNFVEVFSEISASTKELSIGSKEIQNSTLSLLEITENIKTGAEEITIGANEINSALLNIKDASANNTTSMADSREQIEEIHTAINDVSTVSSTNSENMDALLTEVSIFKLTAEEKSEKESS